MAGKSLKSHLGRSPTKKQRRFSPRVTASAQSVVAADDPCRFRPGELPVGPPIAQADRLEFGLPRLWCVCLTTHGRTVYARLRLIGGRSLRGEDDVDKAG